MWYQGIKLSLQSIENECVIRLIVIAAESQKTITLVIVFFVVYRLLTNVSDKQGYTL